LEASAGSRTPEIDMDQRNFLYMFYGFSVAWVVIVVYALTLFSRERKIRKEIDRLKSMIEEKK
jgi:CcmD family protein